MVSTRRSGATEPLERLETPPKRTRKHNSKKPPPIEEIMEVEASPEVIQAIAIEVDTRTSFKDIGVQNRVNADLTSTIEFSATNTNNGTVSTKRRHEETESESLENATPSKRSRIEEEHEEFYLSMFPKRNALDDEDLAVTPKNFGSALRRKKNLHMLSRQVGKYSSLPRQRSAPRSLGDNPFGIQTFSQQELNAARAAREEKPAEQPNDDHVVREERSAAPEPETPRRGLFGSLRDIGSATIGRVFSPFGRAASTPEPSTLPHPRTEPSKRIAVWNVHYPEIEPVQENHALREQTEEMESDKKRKSFEEKHGKTSRRFDHLHTVPTDGEQDQLPFPVKKAESKPKSTSEASSSIEAFAKKRNENKKKRSGDTTPSQPKRAPLFGPDSHFARGTKDPLFQTFFESGDHPAMRKSAGSKRSLEEALPEEAAQAQQTPSRSFRPHVEEEDEGANIAAQDAPYTPATKKQKTSERSALQTPRSALKAPGSIGRTGMSARFNENPIASIKRMSPLAGTTPAGYSSPSSLFQPFSMNEDDSQISNVGMTPSPNTQKNTLANTGKQDRVEILFKQHPGDLLSQAMNEATPSELRGKRVPYVWNDPQDPSWKPSLFNPRPGTFRLLDDDEIEEEQQYLNQMEQDDVDAPEGLAPDPPSTPRMSHAELPKNSASAASAVDSTSAFEAANLEKRRADASKTKPRKASKLAEVTSARSRSPSPPHLDSSDAADASDESAKTPSPVLGPTTAIWTWDSSTNEYISSSSSYPDFAYNSHNELVPAFAIKSSSGNWDDKVKGPDGRTELARQKFYKSKYDDEWADANFPFGPAQTYEEAAVGSKYTHDLIRKNDANCPELVKKCDERFALEWDAHQLAIDNATKEGNKLVAIHPDRDGIEMLDAEDVL